jgi:hypothetical protein
MDSGKKSPGLPFSPEKKAQKYDTSFVVGLIAVTLFIAFD